MIERKDIGARLENWATKFRDRGFRADGKTMTALVCETMKEADAGNLYNRENGIEPQDTPDDVDALKIEQGMRELPAAQRLLLWWCYIKQQHPGYVSRQLSFPVKEFVERFRAAQEAIEDIVDGGNK